MREEFEVLDWKGNVLGKTDSLATAMTLHLHAIRKAGRDDLRDAYQGVSCKPETLGRPLFRKG